MALNSLTVEGAHSVGLYVNRPAHWLMRALSVSLCFHYSGCWEARGILCLRGFSGRSPRFETSGAFGMHMGKVFRLQSRRFASKDGLSHVLVFRFGRPIRVCRHSQKGLAHGLML